MNTSPSHRFFSGGQYVALLLKVRALLVPQVGASEARKAIVRQCRMLRADRDWQDYQKTLKREEERAGFCIPMPKPQIPEGLAEMSEADWVELKDVSTGNGIIF